LEETEKKHKIFVSARRLRPSLAKNLLATPFPNMPHRVAGKDGMFLFQLE
jgi:hypothetical protein